MIINWRRALFTLLLLLSFGVAEERCARIALLSPSLSDLMVELGRGENIVAHTPFCLLPEEQLKRSHNIGGQYALNLERLKASRPTIVFYQGDEGSDIALTLKKMKLPAKGVDLSTLSAIQSSERVIQDYCGETLKKGSAEALLALLKRREEGDFERLKPLFFYGMEREDYRDHPPSMAVGKSFHRDFIEQFGWDNRYQGGLNAPTLSLEAIYHLSPQFIVILVSKEGLQFSDRDALQWHRQQALWRRGNPLPLYIIEGYSTQIPTPRALYRLGEVLEEIEADFLNIGDNQE